MKRELLAHRADLMIIEREISMERKKDKLIVNLKKRLFALNKLLKEKSRELARLKANYLMSENSFRIFEVETQKNEENHEREISNVLDDFYRLQDDYKRVCLDFEKSQEMLVEAAKREVKLQKSLTDAMSNSEKDNTINKLENTIVNLHLELEEMRAKLGLKQKCHCYKNELLSLRKRIAILQKQSKDLMKLKDSLAQNCRKLGECSCEISTKMRREKKIFKKSGILTGDGRCSKTKRIKSIARWICHENSKNSPKFSSTVPMRHLVKTVSITSTSQFRLSKEKLKSDEILPDFGYQSSNSK